MDCREFRNRMREYLRGEISEPLFGRFVDHEAECANCRALAAERAGDLGVVGPFGAGVRADERERVRARTEGGDCRWIELRLAEALEDPLASSDAILVSEHVADCPSCQRMRDALQALPDYYTSAPRLRAERSFTRAVLARTLGERPGFLEVFRALWRRPESVWEAAVACALVAAVLFGSRLPTYDAVSGRLQQVAQAQVPVIGEEGPVEQLGFFTRTLQGVGEAWREVEGRAELISAWGGRVRADFERGDYPALLQEIRTVLEPIGLYPQQTPDNDETDEE